MYNVHVHVHNTLDVHVHAYSCLGVCTCTCTCVYTFTCSVRTGVSDHLKTLPPEARDLLRSYVLRVVVHKVSQWLVCM